MRGIRMVWMVAATVAGGCSSTPNAPIQTSAVATPPVTEPVRGTPIVPGRPARLYVMAGFREADCGPLTPEIKVTVPPAKGEVSLRPNQGTTIQHSASGRCLGRQITGTGIYYTATKGQTGADRFTITATPPNGSPVTRIFNVTIVE